MSFQIIPMATRNYNGRRARRTAFYARQRFGRRLTRIVQLTPEQERDVQETLLDALFHCTGVMEVRATDEGVTLRHIPHALMELPI